LFARERFNDHYVPLVIFDKSTSLRGITTMTTCHRRGHYHRCHTDKWACILKMVFLELQVSCQACRFGRFFKGSLFLCYNPTYLFSKMFQINFKGTPLMSWNIKYNFWISHKDQLGLSKEKYIQKVTWKYNKK
jgi:hypothetical protein